MRWGLWVAKEFFAKAFFATVVEAQVIAHA
jgi:hypothetical protein